MGIVRLPAMSKYSSDLGGHHPEKCPACVDTVAKPLVRSQGAQETDYVGGQVPKLDNATAKRVHAAETGGGFTLLDEDEYILKLKEVKAATKPNRNGDPGWIWQFEVVSGQATEDKFAGKGIRTNTWFGVDSDWFTKTIFEAFEVKPNVHTDTLIGKTVKAVVTQREQTQGTRKGQLTNDIGSIISINAKTEEADEWGDDSSGGSTDDPDF
jgi:hypothetical protein